MLATLLSFTPHGRGLAPDRINHDKLKLASFNPVTGSSYFALPAELQGIPSELINRNQLDNKCFPYCFTAAYHLNHAHLLRNETSYTSCCLSFYSENNPAAHQSSASFEKPVGFKDMESSEDMNSVQSSVFKYEDKSLLELRWSKRFDLTFLMDFL